MKSKKITVPRAAATADEGQSNVTNNVSLPETAWKDKT